MMAFGLMMGPGFQRFGGGVGGLDGGPGYLGAFGNFLPFGAIFMFLVPLTLLVIAGYLVWRASKHTPHAAGVAAGCPAPSSAAPLMPTTQPTPEDAAIRIVRERLAAGEIDATEYQRFMELLRP